MNLEQQRTLLTQAREWFGEPEQVDYLVREVAAGLTPAEGRLLQALRPLGESSAPARGGLPSSWRTRGYDVTGVDVSAPLVAAARALAEQRGTPVRFQQVEPLTLPFEAATFDAAVAVRVHCYIPSRASRRGYLDEVARVLRWGAPLVSAPSVSQ